jgi:hypothetical protein
MRRSLTKLFAETDASGEIGAAVLTVRPLSGGDGSPTNRDTNVVRQRLTSRTSDRLVLNRGSWCSCQAAKETKSGRESPSET